jgi:uncharacterized protein
VQLTVALIYIITTAAIYFDFSSGTDFLSELMDPSIFLSSPHFSNITILYSVLIASFALGALIVLKQKNSLAIRISRSNIAFWAASISIVLGLAGLTHIQMSLYVALGNKIPFIQGALDRYTEISKSFIGSDSILMIILSTCILVPIAEELVFRGLIQGELRRAMPAIAAVIIQAVIFTLVHGNPIQMSYVLLPALIFGLIYEWTGSIYIPIGLHMIFNFTGSALPMILQDHSALYAYVIFILVSMIPVSVLAIIYVYTRRTNTDSQTKESLLQPVYALASSISAPPSDETEHWIHKDLKT